MTTIRNAIREPRRSRGTAGGCRDAQRAVRHLANSSLTAQWKSRATTADNLFEVLETVKPNPIRSEVKGTRTDHKAGRGPTDNDRTHTQPTHTPASATSARAGAARPHAPFLRTAAQARGEVGLEPNEAQHARGGITARRTLQLCIQRAPAPPTQGPAFPGSDRPHERDKLRGH